MRLFDITEARHFCTAIPVYRPGVGQSLVSFHNALRATRISEGTIYFDAHRVSILNAVERWILFGIADYRRALEMLIPSNAPWAHVTLYYSSFFAANAILGMFGAWIDLERVIDVERGAPNSQVLRISRQVRSPSGFRGSHKVFWDFFYEGCAIFAPWVPTSFQSVIAPVNNDRAWQINARNNVNYDTFVAFDAAKLFNNSFNPKRLRSVGGSLGQQLEVTEGMLGLAVYFANHFGVNSFPFEGLGTGNRSKVIRALVTKVPPALRTQSVLQNLLQ
jgi:hypothetical protein